MVGEFSSNFLTWVLHEEELTSQLRETFKWRYIVEYINKEDKLEKPEVFYVNYYSTTTDKFDEVEERWYYDFEGTDNTLLGISLVDQTTIN